MNLTTCPTSFCSVIGTGSCSKDHIAIFQRQSNCGHENKHFYQVHQSTLYICELKDMWHRASLDARSLRRVVTNLMCFQSSVMLHLLFCTTRRIYILTELITALMRIYQAHQGYHIQQVNARRGSSIVLKGFSRVISLLICLHHLSRV